MFFICRFATKESATHAIVAVHNTEINGQAVKCSWGKEAGDPANVTSQVRKSVIVIKCRLLCNWTPFVFYSNNNTVMAPSLAQLSILMDMGNKWDTGDIHRQQLQLPVILQHKCKINFYKECKDIHMAILVISKQQATWGEFPIPMNV